VTSNNLSETDTLILHFNVCRSIHARAKETINNIKVFAVIIKLM